MNERGDSEILFQGLRGGWLTLQDAPPALLLSWDVATQETPQHHFRTSQGGSLDPNVPGDLQAAFAHNARLYWVTKIEGNPFTSMITLGRADNNDIIVPVASLSSVHLIFTRLAGGGFTVTDQGSTNESWLQGALLEPRAPTPIASGDYLVLGGSVRALYLEPDALLEFARAAGGER